jgi:RNA polymerase sigma-70 factor (ECF subfamily)
MSGGDQVARKQLYEQLYVSFRILARHRIADWNDAEEVVQAAMVKVSSKLDQLTEAERFSAWAHAILKHEVIDHYRTVQSRRSRELELEETSIPLRHQSDDGELKAKLKECLKKLNAVFGRHARILNLRYQGYSTGEICERMQLTPNNLYVMLNRARSMLKNCLESGEIRS